MSSNHFTNDRLVKYGFGVVRLAAFVALVFCFKGFRDVPTWGFDYFGLHEYLHSWRWLGHAYIGSIGAFVNVQQGSFAFNMMLLLGAAGCCFWDANYDVSILIYLLKTFGGDFFAGKLDTLEWQLVLIFSFVVFPTLLFFIRGDVFGLEGSLSYSAFAKYSRITLVLFVVQLICEYADAHFENLSVFIRHRYSFEVLNLLLLVSLSQFGEGLGRHELLIVQIDLVICFFYRLSNFLIILAVNFSNFVSMNCLRLLGFATGVPFVRVTDAEVGSIVLRQFSSKGKGLEMFVASKAWLPIL